jgi:hypothetical protein
MAKGSRVGVWGLGRGKRSGHWAIAGLRDLNFVTPPSLAAQFKTAGKMPTVPKTANEKIV